LARPATTTYVSDVVTAVALYHPERVMQYAIQGHSDSVAIVETLYKQLASGNDCTLSEL
jgi:membrane protein